MNGSSDERSIDDTMASSPGASDVAPSDAPKIEEPDTDIPGGVDRSRQAGRAGFALPRRFRWPAVAGVVAVVSVAVLATMLPWQAGSTGNGLVTSSASPNAPVSVNDPGVEPGSTPTERPPILAYTPTASLMAGTTAGGVVALDSDFLLASVDGTAAAELASRITVEPAVELAVEPGPDQTSVRLRPTARLQAGRVYRFTLTAPDGRPLDSWAFQARQSVQVASTVPGDTYTSVPLDTGIEVTFDQDGALDAASHFQIRPRTEGRFEQHGRTLAFIPSRLKAATVYTVTVTHGVKVQGTDETLAEDYRFRFETAARPGTRSTNLSFPNEILDVPSTGRPDLPIWGYNADGSAPTKARIEVYRLRDIGAAIDAFRQLRGSPRWAQWSTDSAVSTTGLRRVMAFDARLRRGGDSLWFRLPATLAPGWYLVQRPSPKRPTQVVLQVTDVAGYLTVSSSRTLVWANDLVTGRALPGAIVDLDGRELGRTDAKGLLLADTPASLLAESPRRGSVAAPDPVVVVRAADRSMFIPAAGSSQIYGEGYDSIGRAEDYWLSYHTDRLVYRRTDAINVWGVIRERAAGAVPDEVEMQLVTGTGDPLPPAITAVRSKPGPTGTFKGSLGLRDIPEGSYDLVLRVGGDVVGSIGIQVDRILKPAYRLQVETGRRVYIRGDRIRITSRASFYEGSPVPGVPLRIDGVIERNVRTDASGAAVYRTTARLDPDSSEDGFEYQSVSVNPARAEEGDIIGASREFMVFPSTRTIDGQAAIRSGRVVVTGAVHLVDRDRLENELAKGASPWDLDPRGKPVGAATVSLTFFEEIPRKVRTGTEYDWIEKKVVPVYDNNVDYQQVRTIKVRTSANGSFSASIRDSGRKHDYHVNVSVGDPDAHTSRTVAFASSGQTTGDQVDFDHGYLEPTTPGAERPLGYAIGDPIDLTFREIRPVASGRYLFQFAQRGLRDASIQSSPHLLTQFRSWAVPNLTISAVHFTGKRYVLADVYGVPFRAADRALTVGLTTTRPRYVPGEEVTLNVRTRDRKGTPVAAAVALQAVDSKLFAMGAAADADPLGDLYSTISSGITWTTASHRMQRLLFGEGGDTTGGGGDEGRVDFRDAVLFDVIQTDANGLGTTTFRLSDDLTSWRVSAAAVTTDMQAGSQSIDVPVGLSFFVDASIAPEYLAGDRPSIQVRTYGSALKPGSPVRITVASESLGLASRTVHAKAFGNVTVALPRLTPGMHAITISASSEAAGPVMSDRMTRSFTVRDSRLEQTKTAYIENVGDPIPGGGRGLTTLVISDASAGRYLPLLLEVSAAEGARLERALGAAMASALLTQRYGAPESVRPAGDFDGDLYQTPDGGIAPVPFAGNDLELTALVAIVAPERFRADRLRQYLVSVLASPKSTRERRVYALTGLAGLGDPVLPQIQALAADPQLTIREQLVTGLGAAAIGDSATARAIATRLWERHGEEVAGSARLRVGDSADDIATATSLMAVLAAATGDARAPAFWAYAEANPRATAPYELFAVAYVDRLIDRLPVAPAQFAVVLDGKRTVVDLDVGESYQLSLTAAQGQKLRIESLKGVIGLTATWREPVAASAIKTDPDIRIQRSRTPAAVVDASDLVRVDISVEFGPKAPTGCHQVTELVPSGLIALGATASWAYKEEEEQANAGLALVRPFAVVGQRVMFCAAPTKIERTVQLRYYARVITPGRYVWEPAVVESRTAPDRAAMTKEVVVRIR
jgi:hypothetical protein